MTNCNYSEHTKIQRKEIQKQIEELQAKLEELENQKTPVEEAYKKVYGVYPIDSIDKTWDPFQAGYNAAYKEPEENEWKNAALKFGEKLGSIGPCGYYEFSPDEWFEWAVNTYEKLADDWLILLNKEKQLRTLTEKLQKKDWKVDVKTNLKPHWEPKPQEPEEVAEGLKEAFRETVKQGVVSSVQKPKTLTDIVYRWWDDVFTIHSDWDMETSIEDLIDRIEAWFPKPIEETCGLNEKDADWNRGYNTYREYLMMQLK